MSRPALDRLDYATLLVERAELSRRLSEVDHALAMAYPRAASSDVYTSEALPPYTSRRAFRSRCASGAVVGATKQGHTWSCSRSAWHATARRPSTKGQQPASKTEANREAIASRGDAANDVDALLAASGLRLSASRSVTSPLRKRTSRDGASHTGGTG